ncbi:unnamed protein product, partial [Durusdinium trenchii]
MIFLCILRQKIESIVRRGGGVADQDCPTSIEDMSYWVVTSRKRTETESLERVADLTAHVDAQSAMGVLTGSDARLERLTGMSLDPSQAPATQDILKFVKDGAGITQPAGQPAAVQAKAKAKNKVAKDKKDQGLLAKVEQQKTVEEQVAVIRGEL